MNTSANETGTILDHFSPVPYRLTVDGSIRAAFATVSAAATALEYLPYDERIVASVTFSFAAL